mmetsp:Transcript_22217/g.74735  ORF Transcript_22217/g.74735 Transcript_22217/m.74735 type:complete len:221 (+) Transcript_22217:83-745(+)
MPAPTPTPAPATGSPRSTSPRTGARWCSSGSSWNAARTRTRARTRAASWPSTSPRSGATPAAWQSLWTAAAGPPSSPRSRGTDRASPSRACPAPSRWCLWLRCPGATTACGSPWLSCRPRARRSLPRSSCARSPARLSASPCSSPRGRRSRHRRPWPSGSSPAPATATGSACSWWRPCTPTRTASRCCSPPARRWMGAPRAWGGRRCTSPPPPSRGTARR